MAGGRPTKYTKQLADFICSELSQGKSMRSIVRDNKKVPSLPTIYGWLRDFPQFLNQYDRAKEDSADALADDMTDIADNQVREYENEEGRTLTDSGSVQHAKLRIDTRKWAASKLKPKKYGEKLDMTSGGEKIGITFDNSFNKDAKKK